MRNLFLFLVSTIALMPSHAAVISERTCTPQQHWGTIMITTSSSSVAFPDNTGHTLDAASTGNNFTQTTGLLTPTGFFYFKGCAGGASFHLYCTSCGSPSGLDVVAVVNTGYNVNNEPDDWVVFNRFSVNSLADPIPDKSVSDPNPATYNVTSFLFTWDLDSTFIRPVTYNNDGSVQPLMYVLQIPGTKLQYEFAASAVTANPVWALWWKENS